MSIQTDERGTALAVQAARARVKDTLRVLKAYRRLTDIELAERTGIKRGAVQTYINGTVKVDLGLAIVLAQAFDVEPRVLLMSPDEALAWCLAHPVAPDPDGAARQAQPSSACFTGVEWGHLIVGPWATPAAPADMPAAA